MPTKLEIDPTNLNSDGKDLAALNRLLKQDNLKPGFSKITKSSGTKKSPTGSAAREHNHKATQLPDNLDIIYLKNYSLIKFPQAANEKIRYYVIAEFKGQGAHGKVKTLPFCFEQDEHGNFIKKILNENELAIIKISMPQPYNEAVQLAKAEVFLAKNAGEDQNAVFGGIREVEKRSGQYKSYIKLSFYPGKNLESFLLENKNLPLAERLRIIRDIIIQLEKINARNYCYLDIKPENIIYDPNKSPCVNFIDWESCEKSDNTINSMKGSPIYQRHFIPPMTQHIYEAHQLGATIGDILSYHSSTLSYEDRQFFAPRCLAYDRVINQYDRRALPANARALIKRMAVNASISAGYDFKSLLSCSYLHSAEERNIVQLLIDELILLCNKNKDEVPTTYLQIKNVLLETEFSLSPLGIIFHQIMQAYKTLAETLNPVTVLNNTTLFENLIKQIATVNSHSPVAATNRKIGVTELESLKSNFITGYEQWRNQSTYLEEQKPNIDKPLSSYIAELNSKPNAYHYHRMTFLLYLKVLCLFEKSSYAMSAELISHKEALESLETNPRYPHMLEPHPTAKLHQLKK